MNLGRSSTLFLLQLSVTYLSPAQGFNDNAVKLTWRQYVSESPRMLGYAVIFIMLIFTDEEMETLEGTRVGDKAGTGKPG